MKKHKTKIILAAVVLAALVGTWVLGGGPAVNTVTADTAPVLAAEISGSPNVADTASAQARSAPELAAQGIAIESDAEADSDSEAGVAVENPSAEETPEALPESADEQAAPDEHAAAPPAEAQPEASPAQSVPAETPDTAQAEAAVTAQPETPDAAQATEPTGTGQPEMRAPVEPENMVIGDESFTVTLTVRVDTLLNNMHLLNREKHELVPADGVIFHSTEVVAYEGESVFNVLQREMRRNRIHMASRFTPIFNSAYVEAINNIYEFDAGPLSGWMYRVNGWFPNFGASRYMLSPGDVIEWQYTVDLGRDLGETWLGGLQRDD